MKHKCSKAKKEYCTVFFYFANKNYAALLTYSKLISTESASRRIITSLVNHI